MGVYLIAFAWSDPAWVWTALKVIIGLGMVIFVHELGHFIVAKLCGVRCDKFYLGFDIAGLKLCRFRWGETEYGIGILPIGGYVKMLGQEDNPSRLRAEIERAKAAAAEGTPGGAPAPPGPESLPQQEQAVAAAEALFNPRSYLAQSVPKRMAIISAGVTMNLVFALLMAMAAYGMGVRQLECAVGEVLPGEAAWQASLTVGDRIEEINGKRMHRFMDLKKAISLGDIEQGVAMVVRRPGLEQPVRVEVTPNRTMLAPTIGITNGVTTTLRRKHPAYPGSPAFSARPQFLGGDRIVKIDGRPVENARQLRAHLALHPEKRLSVTVERAPSPGDSQAAPAEQAAEIRIDLPAAPMRDLGLVMEMGKITAIQQESPAAAAGIRAGDRIVKIDGEPPGDPVQWPDRLRRRAETSPDVTLTVQREGAQEPVEIRVRLRRADWYETPLAVGIPMSAPALGIAYRVGNRVEGVRKDGPAAQADVQPGDVILAAKFLPPDRESLTELDSKAYREFDGDEMATEFGNQEPNWPSFFYALQKSLPETRVELQLQGGRTALLEPAAATDWFNPDRGFLCEPQATHVTARSLGEAVSLGAWETWDSLTLVFRTLHRLGTGQVSMKALAGPVGMFEMAYRSASEGTSELLMFLTLISANLALLNFLPIPVLDGGHMVFLTYEGITGKLPDERVFVGLSYLGLFLLLALMVWVMGLDLRFIPRF